MKAWRDYIKATNHPMVQYILSSHPTSKTNTNQETITIHCPILVVAQLLFFLRKIRVLNRLETVTCHIIFFSSFCGWILIRGVRRDGSRFSINARFKNPLKLVAIELFSTSIDHYYFKYLDFLLIVIG